jgi:glutamate-1-semialdehyde 2,1-aminomutase
VRAKALMPGGVSSPVRSFGAVGGTPLFIHRASGSHIWDVDGNELIDLVMSWGPLIHGHAHSSIVSAIGDAVARGTTFGASIEAEVMLAERIREAIPTIESLRFVSSGTEAAMSVLRLARAFTGRDLVVKFDGCYHGHVDALLVRAGSGGLTHGEPNSAGVPEPVAAMTHSLPYNDTAAFREYMHRLGSQTACVIVEPAAGNMGTIPPDLQFLRALREETERHGALLVFDEVITGFRAGYGGAQTILGIDPDLTCLGKVIGGGLPAAAFGGRRDVMELLSPLGPVYQAGTLSGNPVAMAAGIVALDLARESDYGQLELQAQRLANGITASASRLGIELRVNRWRTMVSCFFAREPVTNLASATTASSAAYARFFHAMLGQGVYLPPSQFETWMLSFAHSDDDIGQVIEATESSLGALVEDGSCL